MIPTVTKGSGDRDIHLSELLILREGVGLGFSRRNIEVRQPVSRRYTFLSHKKKESILL